MSVWIRVGLYILAGWLYGSGWIGAEVKALLTEDPEVVLAVEALIAGLIALVPVSWWRWARRTGRPT